MIPSFVVFCCIPSLALLFAKQTATDAKENELVNKLRNGTPEEKLEAIRVIQKTFDKSHENEEMAKAYNKAGIFTALEECFTGNENIQRQSKNSKNGDSTNSNRPTPTLSPQAVELMSSAAATLQLIAKHTFWPWPAQLDYVLENLMGWLTNAMADEKLLTLLISYVQRKTKGGRSTEVRQSFNDLLALIELRKESAELVRSAVLAACYIAEEFPTHTLEDHFMNAKDSQIQAMIKICANEMPFCKIIKEKWSKVSTKIILALKATLLDSTQHQNADDLVKQIEKCRGTIDELDVKGSEQLFDLLLIRDEIRALYSIDSAKTAVPPFADFAESDAKNAMEKLVLPLQYPDERFNQILAPSSAILLFGAPGTGKAMLAKIAAKAAGAKLFSISSAVISAGADNDAVAFIKMLFSLAKSAQPSAVLFVDEIDWLLGRGMNGRAKAEFLAQMDAEDLHSRMLVVGATCQPWEIDEKALRRFAIRISVKMPNAMAWEKMLKNVKQNSNGFSINEDEIRQLADSLSVGHYSFADFSPLCKIAVADLLHQSANGKAEEGTEKAPHSPKAITFTALEGAIQKFQPLTSGESLKKLDEFEESFKKNSGKTVKKIGKGRAMLWPIGKDRQ